jgi:hypothetical protein
LVIIEGGAVYGVLDLSSSDVRHLGEGELDTLTGRKVVRIDATASNFLVWPIG